MPWLVMSDDIMVALELEVLKVEVTPHSHANYALVGHVWMIWWHLKH